MSSSGADMLRCFALEVIGSGKDIDDTLDEARYGHIVGLNQRHTWGLDPGVGTPLQVCAAHGATEACVLLIDAGADVNFTRPDIEVAHGRLKPPPLHLAIKHGRNVLLVKTLLERGADRSLKAYVGGRLVDAAQCAQLCEMSDPTEERAIISHVVRYFHMPFGAIRKPVLTSRSDPIPSENPVNFVKHLLGTGRDINDIRGGLKWAQEPIRTPLSAVIEAPLSDGQCGDMETVRFLLAAGADVNRMDSTFGGPLHHAIRVLRMDIAKVLLEAGANKHLKADEPGALSALEYACLLASQDANYVPMRMLVEYHMQVWP